MDFARLVHAVVMDQRRFRTCALAIAAAVAAPTWAQQATSVDELSAQATDVGVNKATRRLFPIAGTPQRMLALGLPALTARDANSPALLDLFDFSSCTPPMLAPPPAPERGRS